MPRFTRCRRAVADGEPRARRRGCKPLIAVDHAPDAAIMGDGAIDGRGGEKILGSTYSWRYLAEQARAGGSQQVPRLIVANDSNNFTLYRITLRNSPNFHVTYNHGDGFTVWGVKIDTPQRLARNTDARPERCGTRHENHKLSGYSQSGAACA